jgi:hypothetical protein
VANYDQAHKNSLLNSQSLVHVLQEIRDELRVQHQWTVGQTERSWKRIEEQGSSCGPQSTRELRIIVASVIAFLGGLGLGLVLRSLN